MKKSLLALAFLASLAGCGAEIVAPAAVLQQLTHEQWEEMINAMKTDMAEQTNTIEEDQK